MVASRGWLNLVKNDQNTNAKETVAYSTEAVFEYESGLPLAVGA